MARFDRPATRAKWDAIKSGALTFSDAAKQLGITPNALHVRFWKMGLERKEGTTRHKIASVLKRYPLMSDGEISKWLGARGYKVGCGTVSHHRRKLGIPNAYTRRRAEFAKESPERNEVAIYLRDYPSMTCGEIYASMRADGWSRITLEQIRQHKNTLRLPVRRDACADAAK